MTGSRLGLALLCIVLGLGVEPCIARADDHAPLVILVDPGVPTLARRLREEIEALGLAVRSVPAEDPDVPLDVRARSADAVAAVRIAPSGTGAVEMTIVDRATGKTVSRRLAIDSSSDPAAAELIATRTVELLRASLMELAAEHPVRGEIVVPPVVDELSSEEVGRAGGASLALGPSLVFSSGVSPSFGLWTALRVLVSEEVGLTAALLLPLTSAELETPEGHIDAFATQYRAGVTFEGPLSASPLSLRGEAGLLIAQVSLEGSASSPFVGARENLVAVAPWAGVLARLELTRNLGVLVGGDVAFAFPHVVVRSAGREAASWGRPLGSVAIGGDWSWQ